MNIDLSASRRSAALIRAMSTDYLLREQFVTDPVGIYSEYVRGATPDPDSASVANQLLYAIASDRRLSDWLRTRAAAAGDGSQTDAALASELARQVSVSGDPAAVAALIRAGSSDHISLKPALDLLRALLSWNQRPQRQGAGISIGTEFTPGTGTEFTPGTGTEFTPGTGTEFTPGTGTEVSPGTGTEFTPGTGTEVSPGTGTEFTPGTGTEVSPGTGTEFTPGTGTEVSPGTGTEITPGGILGRLGDLQLVLEALSEFASQVRAVGALLETGFE